MADYQVSNLNLKLSATANDAIKSLENLERKLQNANGQLRQMDKNIETVSKRFDDFKDSILGVNKEADGAVDSFKKIREASIDAHTEVGKMATNMRGLSSASNEMVKTGRSTGSLITDYNRLSRSFDRAFNLSKLVIYYQTFKRLSRLTVEHTNEMISNYGLLTTAMGDNLKHAEVFQKQMQSSFGLSQLETSKYQGFFQSLATNMKITSDGASVMSENLTKLTYDFASLYNLKPEQIYGKIQSGMIGQTKPLRELGIDVTTQTLQRYVKDMGFDVQVQQLTQAEKVLLRYIAIIDQSSLAHGHLAKAIDHPANQLRVFTQTVKEAGAWIGAVFMGTIGKAMQYLTAFAMVIRDVAKSIATLFGFDLSGFSIGGLQAGVDDLDDFATGMDGAGSSAKKLKKNLGLLGFEEINNIQTPEQPSSGGGGGAGGLGSPEIYDQLLSKLKGYDNLMDGVKSKATDIRNRMLDWLGFQYRINKATGELVGLKWGGFGEMATSAKLLLGFLGGIMAFKLAGKFFDWGMGVVNFGDSVKSLGKRLTGLDKMTFGGSVKALMTKVMLPATGIVMGVVGSLKSFKSGLKFGSEVDSAKESLKGFTIGMGLTTVAGGILATTLFGASVATGGLVGALVGAGVGAIGYAFSPAIKQVDLLKDTTAETQERFAPFTKAYNEMATSIGYLRLSEKVVTKEDVDSISANANQLVAVIKDNLANDLEEFKVVMEDKDLFSWLDPNEKNEMVARMEESNKKIAGEAQNNANKIQAILQKASDEKRSLTQEEKNVIEKLEKEMYDNGIKALTVNQEEQDTIRRRMKENAETLTAQQMASIIQESAKARDAVIDDAWAQNAEEERTLDLMLARGAITKEEYDEQIEKSRERRDKTIKDAEKAHEEVYASAKKHGGDMVDLIDKDTGKILKRYEKWWKNIKEGWTGFWDNVLGQNKESGEGLVDDADEMALGYTGAFTFLTAGVTGDLAEMIDKFHQFKDDTKDSFKKAYNENVKPWFTKEKWAGIMQDAWDGLKGKWNNLLKWFKEKVKFPKITMPQIDFPKIKLPKFSLDGKFSLMPPSVPKIGIDWNYYAGGGLPSVGEMYIARESGSELVGRLGNQNAVMNNDQIVESVSKGVASAVASVMGSGQESPSQPTNLYLPNGRLFASWIVDEIDALHATTGKKFKTIG